MKIISPPTNSLAAKLVGNFARKGNSLFGSRICPIEARLRDEKMAAVCRMFFDPNSAPVEGLLPPEGFGYYLASSQLTEA